MVDLNEVDLGGEGAAPWIDFLYLLDRNLHPRTTQRVNTEAPILAWRFTFFYSD